MKRFLSQTEVPWAWALKQGLGDPYKLHQWIWDSLPDDPDAKRDFLFRSDVAHGILRVLLLSERVPGESAEAPWRTTEVSTTFLGHGAYRFQLRANPTFRRASDHRRLAIFDEAALRDWFARKFEAAGCFPRPGSSSSEKGAALVRARYARSTPPAPSSSRTKSPSAPPSTPASVPPRDSASACSSFNPFNSNSQPTRTKQ